MIAKPIVTGEHGAWAILLVPIFTSYAEFGNNSLQFFLIATSVCFTFLAFRPAEIIFLERRKIARDAIKFRAVKNWGIIYLSIALIPALILLLSYQRFYLLYFGLFGAIGLSLSIFLLVKLGKSLTKDLTGILWITSSVVIIHYSVYGAINKSSILLWLLNFLFFASGAFFVHMKMKTMKQSASIFPAPVVANLIYHLLLILILLFLFSEKMIDQLILVAFIPPIIHSVLGSFSKLKIKSFKPIGFTLLGYSILFTVIFFIK